MFLSPDDGINILQMETSHIYTKDCLSKPCSIDSDLLKPNQHNSQDGYILVCLYETNQQA